MKLRKGTPEEAGMSAERMRYIVDEGMHPSLVVLAARRGIIVLHKAFGTLSPEPDALSLQLDTEQ